jgi:hypothetical protein
VQYTAKPRLYSKRLGVDRFRRVPALVTWEEARVGAHDDRMDRSIRSVG